MTINSINGANTQAGQVGMNQATDSYSRNIQNQIANAQKQLQELSSNKDLSVEEKMKKRQEIQQLINDLNVQLRQHQAELRREKQQAKDSSMNDMTGGTGSERNATAGSENAGLSQVGMTAIISADNSVKQAKVQGSVARSMEGKANILKSEIANSHSGGNVKKKQEELADLEQKAQAATASQMSTLADAKKTIENAAQEDRTTEKTTDSGAKEEKAQDGVSDTDVSTENTENGQQDNASHVENVLPAETAAPEAQPAVYTHVDVRL